MSGRLVSDLTNFLGPLEKTKDVAASNLASIMAQLDIKPRDSEEVLAMKPGVRKLRVLMEVLVVVKESKDIVTFFKASGLASSLSKKVLQQCETRWNSLHTMLASALGMYDEVCALDYLPVAPQALPSSHLGFSSTADCLLRPFPRPFLILFIFICFAFLDHRSVEPAKR